MAQYTGLKSLLDAALDKYALQGFELKEYDDDFIILYHDGDEILRARQNMGRITAQFIQCQCEAHLTEYHGVARFTTEARK